MKHIIILICLAIFFSSCDKNTEFSDSQAQQFIKIFGFSGIDSGEDVLTLEDGGYILTGTTTLSGSTKILVVRTDKFGNKIWSQTYGDSLNYQGVKIISTNDNSYYLSGNTEDINGYTNIYISKISLEGNIIWQKIFGTTYNDLAKSMTLSNDGGVVIAGNINTNSESDADYTNILLMKVSVWGDSLWSKKYGGKYFDGAEDIISKNDGGFIVVGSSATYSGNYQSKIIIVETDDNGMLQAMTNYGEATNNQAYSIAQTSTGYIVAGSASQQGSTINDMLVLSIATDIYTLNWSKTIGTAKEDVAYTIAVNDNSLYIGGIMSDENTGNKNASIITLDFDGNEFHTEILGSEGAENINALKLTADGGIIAVGATEFEENAMITLTKLKQ